MGKKHKDIQVEDKNENVEETVKDEVTDQDVEKNVEQVAKQDEEIVEETVEGKADEDKDEVIEETLEIAAEEAETKKSHKKVWCIIGIICGLIVIAGIAVALVFFLPKGADKASGANVDEVVDEEVSEEKEVSVELKAGGVTTVVNGREVVYNAAYVVDGIEATISAGEYESLHDNEVVFLVVNGGSLMIDGNVAIKKTGSKGFVGGDEFNYYGMNSAIVVIGEGSTATINSAKITTDVYAANAVMAINKGQITINNSKIETTGRQSSGFKATFGGEIIAENVLISAKGDYSPALSALDGGAIDVDKMTLETSGLASPLMYSTGSISATGSKGNADASQIAIIEGEYSISLKECDFSAKGNGRYDNIDNAGIVIYQSTTISANSGVGSFAADGCRFTINPDSDIYIITPLIFVTNAEANIELNDVEAEFYDQGYFLLAKGTEKWGRSGSNGGKVTINATNLDVTNTNIGVDGISSVEGF